MQKLFCFLFALGLLVSCRQIVEERATIVDFQTLAPTSSQSNPKYGKVLNDIVQHAEDSDSYDDPITLGHETTHGINAYIRNNLNSLGRPVNGFYVLNGQAIVIAEPNMHKSDVAAFIPQSLQGSRYQLYVVGQTDWDSEPLYIWDEWSAYTNGGAVGIDLEQQNLWTYGWTDGVDGIIEFTVYGIATVMAIKQYEPAFLADTNFLKAFQIFVQRAMDTFNTGKAMKDFTYDVQDKYLAALQTSPDATAMRQFIKDTFGADFTYMEFGF